MTVSPTTLFIFPPLSVFPLQWTATSAPLVSVSAWFVFVDSKPSIFDLPVGLPVLLHGHLPVVPPVVGGELGHFLLDLRLGGEEAARLTEDVGLLVSQSQDVTLHGLRVALLLQTLLHPAVVERVVPLVPRGELRDELQSDHGLAGGLQFLEQSPQLGSPRTAPLALLASLACFQFSQLHLLL